MKIQIVGTKITLILLLYFWGRFFHVFGCKKKFQNFFENVVASALKRCIVTIWEIFFYFFLKFSADTTIFTKKKSKSFLNWKTWKKPPSNTAKFTINCVLLYWRHLLAQFLYNEFAHNRYYGITGCGVFKVGIQNWKGFSIKINCSQMKLLNFENWTNGEPQ